MLTVNTELMGHDEVRRLLSLKMDGLPQATFGYRADNGLPDFLTYPSGMTKKIAYEIQRNNIISMNHKSYQGAFIDDQSAVRDRLSRVTALNEEWTGCATISHLYEYSTHSELVRDWRNGTSDENCVYAYDSIGNRMLAQEITEKSYIANHLNQYTKVTEVGATESVPVLEKMYHWDTSEPVITRPLVMTCFSSNKHNWYEYTHSLNKNVCNLTDRNGNIVAHYDYDAYGNLTEQSGEMSMENPFRFSSEFQDDELGLVYYNYRHYNPGEGRWISREPLGEIHDKNIYYILNNNTISNIDYIGLIDGKKTKPPKYNNWGINNDSNDTQNIGIQCDGKGKAEPRIPAKDFQKNMKPFCFDCIEAHEKSHAADVNSMKNNPCKGQSKGSIPAYGDMRTQRESELRAYDAQLNCISDKSKERQEKGASINKNEFIEIIKETDNIFIAIRGLEALTPDSKDLPIPAMKYVDTGLKLLKNGDKGKLGPQYKKNLFS